MSLKATNLEAAGISVAMALWDMPLLTTYCCCHRKDAQDLSQQGSSPLRHRLAGMGDP